MARVLARSIGVFLFSVGITAHAVDAPPTFSAQAWLLMDHDSGQVLAEHNADKPLAPASLTKLMVSYLVFEQLRANKLKPEEPVRVSARAAVTNGARLFLRPETAIALETLLKGMIVRSANDATIALAEHLGGSDDSRDGGRSEPSWPSRGITPSLEGRGRAASGDGRDAGGRATPGAVAGTAAEDVRSSAFSLPKIPGGKFPP